MARNNGRGATQEAPPKEKADPPVWSRRIWTGAGTVECAVFSKMVGEGDKEFETFNLSLKRTYREESGAYKSVTGFRMEDIPVAIQLLSQAYEFIADQMNRE